MPIRFFSPAFNHSGSNGSSFSCSMAFFCWPFFLGIWPQTPTKHRGQSCSAGIPLFYFVPAKLSAGEKWCMKHQGCVAEIFLMICHPLFYYCTRAPLSRRWLLKTEFYQKVNAILVNNFTCIPINSTKRNTATVAILPTARKWFFRARLDTRC